MIWECDLLLTKGQSQSLALWVNYSKPSVLAATNIFLSSLYEACEFLTLKYCIFVLWHTSVYGIHGSFSVLVYILCFPIFFQTCLSKGGGFHFPPCHMLNFCGLRILLDCPLDLSALTVFSPLPTVFKALPSEEDSNSQAFGPLSAEVGSHKRQKMEKPLDANNLIFAEPWYKSVKNLHLWNFSSIDVILISRPMGMLGLPFLTRTKGFSAKVPALTFCHSHCKIDFYMVSFLLIYTRILIAQCLL